MFPSYSRLDEVDTSATQGSTLDSVSILPLLVVACLLASDRKSPNLDTVDSKSDLCNKANFY